MTTAISFALYSVVAAYWLTVPPFVSVFMVFVAMAICIDYAVFLLSRFTNSGKVKGMTHDEAIRDMLQYSGHEVILSGTILILLEIGFALFFPGGNIDSAGYGIALSVTLSMAISISFTTAPTLSKCWSLLDRLDNNHSRVT